MKANFKTYSMKQVYKNAFEDAVICPDCGIDLSGTIQRDDMGQPFFTAYCKCGEVVVSCFNLLFET